MSCTLHTFTLPIFPTLPHGPSSYSPGAFPICKRLTSLSSILLLSFSYFVFLFTQMRDSMLLCLIVFIQCFPGACIFLHVSNFSFFKVEQYFIMYKYHLFFIQSSFFGYTGCSQDLAVINCAAKHWCAYVIVV